MLRREGKGTGARMKEATHLPLEVWSKIVGCSGEYYAASLLNRDTARLRWCAHLLPRYIVNYMGPEVLNSREILRLISCLDYLHSLAVCFHQIIEGGRRRGAHLLPFCKGWHSVYHPPGYALRLWRSPSYCHLQLFSKHPAPLILRERCHASYRLTAWEVRWARRHCPLALALIF